jgi:hypothetical protein
VVTPSCLLDLVEHEVEGDPLLVDEDELLPGAQLLGSDGEQLLARRHARAQQPIGVHGGVGRGEPAAQVVEPGTAVLSGEKPA